MSVDPRKFLLAAPRRRRLLCGTLTAPLAAAALYLALVPAHFTATLPVAFGAAVEARDSAPIGFEAALRRLTSREVLRRLAEAERAVSAERRPNPLGLLLGGSILAPSIDALSERLARAISVKPASAPGRFDIRIHADSRDEAFRLTQSLREAFAAIEARDKAAALDAESKRQDRRLGDLQNRMDESARRLSAFREANPELAAVDALVPSAASAPVASPQEAKARRIAAQTRLASAEAALRAGAKGSALENLPDSPAMEKLRADYVTQSREAQLATANLLPRHPDYLAAMARVTAAKERLLAEVRRVAQNARRDLYAAVAAERRASKDPLASTAEGSAQDARAELAGLQDEALRSREAYEAALLQRPAAAQPLATTDVETSFGEATVTRDPTAPSPATLFGVAAALGLAIWLGESARRDLAAAPEAPEPEAAAEIPLPKFAGALHGRRSGPRQRAREIVETPGEPYRAAVGGLYRLLAKRRASEEATQTILVKAQAPGVGASTLALALAFFAARRGARILLVTGGPTEPAKAHRYGKGEIMLAPGRVADPRLAQLREAVRYDLIIVDGGADTPKTPIDATLIVARDAKTGERKARLLWEERPAAAARLARAA